MKKIWIKPIIEEIPLEYDKDVLAACWTTSSGNNSSQQNGCSGTQIPCPQDEFGSGGGTPPPPTTTF